MQKLLILTANSDRHFFFVNEILHKYGENTKVILNGKSVKRSKLKRFERFFKNPIAHVKNRILNIIFLYYGKKLNSDKSEQEDYFFGGQKQVFFSQHKTSILDRVKKDDVSLNSPRILRKIVEYKPDLIIVMGTCLLSSDIIKSAKTVLNLHTGLSPYYRGGLSNFWPFINDDMDKFGVTIHLMTTGIDSGPIIYSESLKFTKGTTYPEINCQAITCGTKLMLNALDNVLAGEQEAIDQWSKGLVYHNVHYNHYYAFKYYRKLKVMDQFETENIKNNVISISNGVKQNIE